MSVITVHIFNHEELHDIRNKYNNDINNIKKIIVHSGLTIPIYNFQDVNNVGVFQDFSFLEVVYFPREISVIGPNIFKNCNNIRHVIFDLFQHEFNQIYDYQIQYNNLTAYHDNIEGLSFDIYYTKHKLTTNEELNHFLSSDIDVKSYTHTIDIPENTDISVIPANFFINTKVDVFTISPNIKSIHETAFSKGLDTTVINMTEDQWNMIDGSLNVIQYSRNVVYSFYTINKSISITKHSQLTFNTANIFQRIHHVHLDSPSDIDLLLTLPKQIEYIDLITYNSDHIQNGIELIDILNYDASGSEYYIKTHFQLQNIRSKVPLVETIYLYSNSDITNVDDLNGIGVFQDITCLKTVYLPNTIQSIGHNIFLNCYNLTTIIFNMLSFQLNFINNFNILENTYISANRYASNLLISTQDEMDNFMAYSDDVRKYIRMIDIAPDGNLNNIPNSFLQGTSVTEITIPKTVTTIGQHAFIKNMLIVVGMSMEQWETVDGSLNVIDITNNITFSYFQFSYETTNQFTINSNFTFEPYVIFNDDTVYIKHQYEVDLFFYSIQQPKYTSLIEQIYIQPNENTTLHLPNYFFQHTSVSNLYIPNNVNMDMYTFDNTNMLSYVFFDMAKTDPLYTQLHLNNITSYFSQHVFNTNNDLETYKQDYVVNNKFNHLVHDISFSPGNTITYIPSHVFENCKISTIDLPIGLKRIEDYAFKNTSIYGILDLPTGIHYYGEGCFLDCSNIITVFVNGDLGDGIHLQVKEKAFYLNSLIKFQCIIDNKQYTNENNFKVFGNDETDLSINSTLSFANDYHLVFRKHTFVSQEQLYNHVQFYSQENEYNTYITYLDFFHTSDITNIPDYAFYSTNITNDIVLPKYLKTIGEYSFAYIQPESMSIENERNVIINTLLETIKSHAFAYSYFNHFVIDSSNSNLKMENSVFTFNGYSINPNFTPVLLSFTLNNLTNLDYWKQCFKDDYTSNFINRDVILNLNITFNTESDFKEDVSLNEFITTDTYYKHCSIIFSSIKFSDLFVIKVFRKEKFYNLHILSLYIPSTVLIIDDECFKNCSLKTIHFSDNSQLYYINNSAFENVNRNIIVSSLDLLLPYNLFKIGENAFRNANVDIAFEENNIQLIGKYAFADSSLNTSTNNTFTIPSNIEIIEEGTFQNCSITSIVFTDNSIVHTIQNNAFENTTIVQNITLPQTLQSIGTEAFKNSLQANIVIPNAIRYIGKDAFKYDLPVTDEQTEYEIQFSYSYHTFVNVIIETNTDISDKEDIFSLNIYTILYEGLYFDNQSDVDDHYEKPYEERTEINSETSIINFNLQSDIKTLPSKVFNNATVELIMLPSSLTTVGFDAFRNAFLLETVIIDSSYIGVNYEENILHFNDVFDTNIADKAIKLDIQPEINYFLPNSFIVLDKYNILFHRYDIESNANNLLLSMVYTNEDERIFTYDISNTETGINKEYTDYELLFMKVNDTKTRYVCGYGKENTSEDGVSNTYETDILIYEITEYELSTSGLELSLVYKTTVQEDKKIEQLVISNTNPYLETDFIFYYYGNFVFKKYNYNDSKDISFSILYEITEEDGNTNIDNSVIDIKHIHDIVFKIDNLSINRANNYILYNYFHIPGLSSSFKTNGSSSSTYKQNHFTVIHQLYVDNFQLRKITTDISENIPLSCIYNMENDSENNRKLYSIDEIEINIGRKSILSVEHDMNYLISYLYVDSKNKISDGDSSQDFQHNKTRIYFFGNEIDAISRGRNPDVFNRPQLTTDINHSEFSQNSDEYTIMHGIQIYPKRLNSNKCVYFLLSVYGGTRLYSVFKNDLQQLETKHITTFLPVTFPVNSIPTDNNVNPIVVIDNDDTLIIGNSYETRNEDTDDLVNNVIADFYNIRKRTLVYTHTYINNEDEFNDIKHVLELNDNYVKTIEFTNNIKMIHRNQFINVRCDTILLPCTINSIGNSPFVQSSIKHIIIDMYEDEFDELWSVHNNTHYNTYNNIRFSFRRVRLEFITISTFSPNHMDISYIQYVNIGTIDKLQLNNVENDISNSILKYIHTVFLDNYPFEYIPTKYKFIYTKQIFNEIIDVEPFYDDVNYKYVTEIIFNGIPRIDYDKIFYNTHIEVAICTANQNINSEFFNKKCIEYIPYIVQIQNINNGELQLTTDVNINVIKYDIFNGFFQDISDNFSVDYKSKTITMLSNIDLSNVNSNFNINSEDNFILLPSEWTLDGKYFSIEVTSNFWYGFIKSNVEVPDDGTSISLDKYCKVQNLNILNVRLNANSGGIVFSNQQYVDIINCCVKITENTNTKWGGIIGSNCSYINIYKCFTEGNIYQYSGGIVAYDCNNINCTLSYSTGNIQEYAGGIIGPYCNDCTIKLCHSTGNIQEYAGGIAAGDFYESYVSEPNETKEQQLTQQLRSQPIANDERKLNHFIECYATGELSSHSGGICGSLSGYYTKIKIDKCYFLGTYESSSHTNCCGSGGIIGSYSGYNGSIEINNSYVKSAISGKGSGGIVGGFCGIHREFNIIGIGSYSNKTTLYNVTINGCYFNGELTGDYVGGITGSHCVNVNINNCFSHSKEINQLAAGIIGSYKDKDDQDDKYTENVFNINVSNTSYTGNEPYYTWLSNSSDTTKKSKFIGGSFSKKINIILCFTEYSFFRDVYNKDESVIDAFLSYTLSSISINIIVINQLFQNKYKIEKKYPSLDTNDYNVYLKHFNNSSNTLTNPWSKDTYNTNQPKFMFNFFLSTDVFKVDFENTTVYLKTSITSTNIDSILTSSSHLFLGDGWTFDGDYNYIDLLSLTSWGGFIECNNTNGKKMNIIKNLGIINGSNVTSDNGYFIKAPSAFLHIENCYLDNCSIKSSYTGGFIGITHGDTIIQNSYFSGKIENNTEEETVSNINKAGFIYKQEGHSLKIYSCYCNCDIITTSSSNIGGFICIVDGSHLDISNCYFKGYIGPQSFASPIIVNPMNMSSVTKKFYNIYANGYDMNDVSGESMFFNEIESSDLSNVYAVGGKISNIINGPNYDIEDFSGGTIWDTYTQNTNGFIADTYTNSYPILASFKQFPWLNYDHNTNPTYHHVYFFGDFNTFIDYSFFIDYQNKIAYISKDITINDMNSHIVLNDGWVFDGNNKTITFTTLDWMGLIKTNVDNSSNRVRIVNTNIKLDYETLEKKTSKYIRDILNVNNSNTRTYNNGYILQKNQSCAHIEKCSVFSDIPYGGGGIVGGSCKIFSVKECFVIGNINDNAGGIVGSHCDIFTIEKCYSQGNIYLDGGGILGSQCGNHSDNKISSCYSLGNIIGENAGGIIGANSNTILIEDVYSTGQIYGNNSSGIVGNNNNKSYIIRLYNCICYGAIESNLRSDSSTNYIFPDGLFIENRNCFDNNLTYIIYEPSANDISVNDIYIENAKYSIENYDFYNFVELSANWTELYASPTYKMQYKIIRTDNKNEKIFFYIKDENNTYINIEQYDSIVDSSAIYIYIKDTDLINNEYSFNYHPILINDPGSKLITLGNFYEPGEFIQESDITKTVNISLIDYNTDYDLSNIDAFVDTQTSMHYWKIELRNNLYASDNELYFKINGISMNGYFVSRTDITINNIYSNKYLTNDIVNSFGTSNYDNDFTFKFNKNIGFDFSANESNYIRFVIGLPLSFMGRDTYLELKVNKNTTFNTSFSSNDIISLNLNRIE